MRIAVFPSVDDQMQRVSKLPGGVLLAAFGRSLTIDRVSQHFAALSEREGWQRWHYLGPICWRWKKSA